MHFFTFFFAYPKKCAFNMPTFAAVFGETTTPASVKQ